MTSTLPASIFRAYDIRGIAETELTDPNLVEIARGITHKLHALKQTQLIIGRDGRLSSPRLFDTLSKAFITNGIDVIDIGIVPTPVFYFACHTLSASSGIMITASHNPAQYNGIKFLITRGVLSPQEIQSLYTLALKPLDKSEAGSITIVDNINEQYQKALLDNIQLKQKPRVVIDYSNGATTTIAPSLFRALGCDVIDINNRLDGNFPSHPPEPTQPDNLKALMAAIKTHEAEWGIAFDGDGDRVVIVQANGEMIYPDRLLALFAEELLKINPHRAVVYDVKCSYQLKTIIENNNGISVMSPTGHTLIKRRGKETNAILAGEMSGHFIFYDRWYDFDDGLYTAARFLELLNTLSKNDITSRLINTKATPEIQLAVHENDINEITNRLTAITFKDASISLIDGLRADFDNGFALVRKSNTSNYLVFRFEAETESQLKSIIDEFKREARRLIPELELNF